MKLACIWAGFVVVGCHASASPPPPTSPTKTTSAEPASMKLGGKAKLVNNELQIPGKISFENDKAVIKEDKVTKEVLDALLATLKDNPSITKLRIEGYTDDKGPVDHDTKLSQDRADAISKWLQARGIDASRLLTAGLGAARPLVDNDSDEHREQNRRTEFKIWEQDGKPTPASQVPDPPPPAPAAPTKK